MTMIAADQYATYSREKLESMRDNIEAHRRHEQWASDGDHLRAEIARAAVRECDRQLAKIYRALRNL
jgi:hypothetical protein